MYQMGLNRTQADIEDFDYLFIWSAGPYQVDNVHFPGRQGIIFCKPGSFWRPVGEENIL